MASYLVRTPLINGPKIVGKKVLFKCEFLQPSGSFKDRGIGYMISALSQEKDISRIICSSGGNAGLSVATVGEQFGIPVDVFVPSSTLPLMVEKLKRSNANVTVAGSNWNEADAAARAELAAVPGAQYVPPYDHPLIWEGHRSLVREIYEDLGGTAEGMPDVIVLCVGGGGLLRGVQLELESLGLAGRTRVVAVETQGAASFAAAKAAGNIVKLDKIDTIATSLGALSVLPSTLMGPVRTSSAVVTDKQAVNACVRLLEEQRVLVEPSCGSSLSLVYDEELLQQHFTEDDKTIAVVVCGGSCVSPSILEAWKEKFGLNIN